LSRKRRKERDEEQGKEEKEKEKEEKEEKENEEEVLEKAVEVRGEWRVLGIERIGKVRKLLQHRHPKGNDH